MVSSGSIATLSITSVTTIDTADSIVAQVSSALAGDGRLTVKQTSIGGSLLNAIMGTIASLSMNQPFQVTMLVQANTDFTGTDDPLSIVENAFYNVTGTYPSTGSTVSVQAPGAAAVATGQPGAAAAGPGGTVGTGSAIADSISSFFSGLGSTAKSLVIGLAAILILVLVLIAYGPNIGKAAARV